MEWYCIVISIRLLEINFDKSFDYYFKKYKFCYTSHFPLPTYFWCRLSVLMSVCLSVYEIVQKVTDFDKTLQDVGNVKYYDYI